MSNKSQSKKPSKKKATPVSVSIRFLPSEKALIEKAALYDKRSFQSFARHHLAVVATGLLQPKLFDSSAK